MEGECLCKGSDGDYHALSPYRHLPAVAVKVNDDNLFGEQRRGHICHCANCRKVAGGITDNHHGVHLVTMHRVNQPLTELWGLGLHRFGVNLTIEEEKVEFPKGKDNIKLYSVRSIPVISFRSPNYPSLTRYTQSQDPETLSGTPVQRYFCQTCGVPIMSITPLYKGKIVLKLGLYPKLPVPEWESFASKRQSWEKPFEGTIQYKTKGSQSPKEKLYAQDEAT
ncbi:uncharacterized protein A1O5_09525 [Cladophialophora psammophila CBS 110553]|uniref:CENP-V/GFA domain-containing protein n=1 Tax=Cladophialophora psammophila CBS 110553 TaxID=1182543 RepID=W9WH94_9EURO|nr:uncharacterized protein A1O5_09525 [Cladophialophora psammophila CBS 110553]EXJ67512.1 hypothetical protein A1O5_09525 [Cladophialophora psammophila CBS 110553]